MSAYMGYDFNQKSGQLSCKWDRGVLWSFANSNIIKLQDKEINGACWERVQMYTERVDEEGHPAQRMLARTLFPCFSRRFYPLHSKCLSLTPKENEEETLAQGIICPVQAGLVSWTSGQMKNTHGMRAEKDEEAEYYDVRWVRMWKDLPEENLSYM